MIWILALAVTAFPQDAVSLASASSTPSPQCQVEFIHKPTGAEVADYYPMAAFPQRLPGDTAIDCIADKHLGLTKCQVTFEDPEGYGFGDATIKYFSKNARSLAVDDAGTSCIGRHVTAKFRWQFS